MKLLQFTIDEDVRIKANDYNARNDSFLKLSLDEKLNKLVSLGFDVLIEMEELEQIKQEVENNNLTIDNEDIVTELPVRVNIKLDQLKKFNDMAKKENLPINKLMSVVLNQYINNYFCTKKKLCKEDVVTFREHALKKITMSEYRKLMFNQ